MKELNKELVLSQYDSDTEKQAGKKKTDKYIIYNSTWLKKLGRSKSITTLDYMIRKELKDNTTGIVPGQLVHNIKLFNIPAVYELDPVTGNHSYTTKNLDEFKKLRKLVRELI